MSAVERSVSAISRGDPRQDSLVHHSRLLDLREVPGALDDLHSRPRREVTLGVLDEREIDAAIAIPVQIQGRLRSGVSQRRLLGRVCAIRDGLAECGPALRLG